jgi:hypothetical protein
MRYAWLVLGVFAARFLATAIAFPQIDGDLSWQRWLGGVERARHAIPRQLGDESFAAIGARWTPQEWAFSLAASYARGGIAWDVFAGSIALGALGALVIAGLLALRRGASRRAIALCTALAGIALFSSFGVRVQVAAWPLLAAFLFFLDVDGPWAFAALAIAALWSNVHASAMLAPIVAGLAALGTLVDERGFTPNVRRLTIIALGSVLAICCNPFGWDLPIYALSLFGSPIKHYITEWKPTELGDTSFTAGALPLLLLALVFFAENGKRRLRDLFVVAAFAFLTLSAARNIALFGIVGLAYVAPALTRSLKLFAPEPPVTDLRAERIARVAMPAIACVLAIVVAIGLLTNQDRTEDNIGQHAIASLAQLPGERHVYCADFAWCSLAVGKPNVSVFLDGRADPYPIAVWDDFLKILRPEQDWQKTIARRGIDTLVVSRDSNLDQVVARTPGWRQSYVDKRYRVWEATRVISRTRSVG